jgi:hypothetical protein
MTRPCRSAVAATLALLFLSGPIEAQDAPDRFAIADSNGSRARQALAYANAFLKKWAERKDDGSALLQGTKGRNVWSVRSTATRVYPQMAAAAYLTDRDLFDGLVTAVLADEARLTARLLRLPDDYDLGKARPVLPSADPDRISISSAAYVSKGLAPVAELTGPGPWVDRIRAIVDDLFTLSTVVSPFDGEAIPSSDAEVNGHILCALPRLAAWTGEGKYLDWARRIADAYCRGVIPANRGLPADRWDFAAGRARESGLSLNGTGYPIITGLVDLYAFEMNSGTDRAAIYGPPVGRMIEILLTHAMAPEGQFYARIEPERRGGYSVDRKNRSTAWAHLLSAVLTYGQASNNEAHIQTVLRALEGLPAIHDRVWRDSPRRLASELPGLLTLLHRTRPYRTDSANSLEGWVDARMAGLFAEDLPAKERIDEDILARAALSYAWHKATGMRVAPWADSVRCGTTTAGDTLYVSLSSGARWEGRIFFDTVGDQGQPARIEDRPPALRFPNVYPIRSDLDYAIEVQGAGGSAIWDGSLMEGGFEVTLSPTRTVNVRIHPVPDPASRAEAIPAADTLRIDAGDGE